MLASEFEIIKSKYLTEDVFASLTLELFLGLDSSNVKEVICKIGDYGVKGALNMAWTASQGLISIIDYLYIVYLTLHSLYLRWWSFYD